MKGIAVERWDWKHKLAVKAWLKATFGEDSPTTWYEDQDFGLLTLVMTDEIYNWYTLRWGDDNC